MGNFKIVYDSNACIGAGTCSTVSKELWSMGKDNKAVLKGSTGHNGVFELELDDSQYKAQSAVVEGCPSSCISIKKL